MEQVAILSDVHGNMTALDAVLDDIDARGIQRIFNLGDLFGKGPNGSAVIATTRERCEATVRGNWDELVNIPRDAMSPALGWWTSEMSAGDHAWLRSLPFSVDIALGDVPIRLFHASSDSVSHRVHRRHTNEDFRSMFGNTDATGDGPVPDIVVYGDIHAAYIEHQDGRTLANCGSVGNPLDEPTAAYLILTAAHEVTPRIVRVPYDIEREIAIAETLGMPDLDAYATELRTSLYRGLHATRPG